MWWLWFGWFTKMYIFKVGERLLRSCISSMELLLGTQCRDVGQPFWTHFRTSCSSGSVEVARLKSLSRSSTIGRLLTKLISSNCAQNSSSSTLVSSFSRYMRWQRVRYEELWSLLIGDVEIIFLQSQKHTLQSLWCVMERFLRNLFQRRMIRLDGDHSTAVCILVKAFACENDSQ